MMHTLRDEGKVRFIGLSDWDGSRIMKFIERVDPDVVQPYRNLINDDYEASGLKRYVDAHDLGVAFFSPLKHGLLLGKYTEPQTFPEGDFRSGIADFHNPEAIARYRRAADEVRRKFPDREEPVLHAVVGALLTDNPTATVLLGQRSAKQTEAVAKIGEALSESEAAWVRGVYQ
jgi:aryl-alcohol dehydrogenase-like predicted oxidoreductase